MITLKGLTIVAALLAGVSLAMAQNGLPTGGESPVAGGANGNAAAPGFDQAPGVPGYAPPAYIVQPGYVESAASAWHKGAAFLYVAVGRLSSACAAKTTRRRFCVSPMTKAFGSLWPHHAAFLGVPKGNGCSRLYGKAC